MQSSNVDFPAPDGPNNTANPGENSSLICSRKGSVSGGGDLFLDVDGEHEGAYLFQGDQTCGDSLHKRWTEQRTRSPGETARSGARPT